MYSIIFLAKVDGLEDCLEIALPELKRRFGVLSVDEARRVIGVGKLLEEATNACLRDNCTSIREEGQRTGAWIDVIGLCEKAIKNNNEPICSKHGSIPYIHGYCPFCTK